MPGNRGKLKKQLWEYLKDGHWTDATVAADSLVKLEKWNAATLTLASAIREIATISDFIRSGNSPGNEATLKLEDISGKIPRLAELDSFKAFYRQVNNKSIKTGLLKSKRDNRNWISHFIHPNGKKGITVTVSLALFLVLLINFLGYNYLQTYPPAVSAFRPWDCFRGIQELDSKVNTLLLGDSTCAANLDTGAFADRLGGRVIDLSVYGGMPILLDAWLLSAYIQKFGPPANAVVSRLSYGYTIPHPIEFLAAPPLPWAYWDKLGVIPEWENGELLEFFISKHLVLYSYADVFRDRLDNYNNFFEYTRRPLKPSALYTRGSNAEQQELDTSTKQPSSLFRGFEPSSDTTNAIRYMSDLARKHQFQLYFVFQPEWDEAINSGLRQPILEEQVKFLSRFIDSSYVHIVRNESLTFAREQMQNRAHLRPGADHIKTESDISEIVSIQNQLTSSKAAILALDSITLDKQDYKTLQQPVISILLSAQTGGGKRDITGSVCCLAKPSGKMDGNWTSRTAAKNFSMDSDEQVKLDLKLDIGSLDKAGVYDLVIFVRQDVGNLSNEKRIERPSIISVSRSDMPVNSSFEQDANKDGIPDNWIVNQSYIRRSTDYASEGSASLTFDMNAIDADYRRAYSALMPVTEFASYIGSIDTFYSSLNSDSYGNLVVYIDYYADKDSREKPERVSLVRPKAALDSWTTTTFSWTPPEGAKYFRILLVVSNKTIAKLYWDNLQVSENKP